MQTNLYIVTEGKSVVEGMEDGVGGKDYKGTKDTGRLIRMFIIFTVVMVSRKFTYVKTY